MAGYTYYVVESSFVARIGPGTTERLMRDGSWVDYPERWRVLTEGWRLENEEEALATARQIFELDDAHDAGRGTKS